MGMDFTKKDMVKALQRLEVLMRPPDKCSECNFFSCLSGCVAWHNYALELEAKLESRGRSLIAEQNENARLQTKLERVEKCLEDMKAKIELYENTVWPNGCFLPGVLNATYDSWRCAADLLAAALKEGKG